MTPSTYVILSLCLICISLVLFWIQTCIEFEAHKQKVRMVYESMLGDHEFNRPEVIQRRLAFLRNGVQGVRTPPPNVHEVRT